jgi:CBS domain-containing protein
MFINVALVVFNMIPAFPMDGGRVLRAMLAWRMNYLRATQVAARIGQGLAIMFGVLGLFSGNAMLVLIALFVFLGAQQEAQMVELRSMLRGVPVREAMIRRFRAVAPQDSLDQVVALLLTGEQQDFPVIDGSRIVGMLTRAGLLAALADGKREGTVSEFMRADCGSVDEMQPLETIFERMHQGQCPALPVLRHGELVGMITLENIGEWMMIQSALRQATPRGDVENVLGSWTPR